MVIALLDWTQLEAGTAWKIGCFYRRKLDEAKIIGI